MWKGCAFANAARNGVFAATLAADGLTGPAPIFEGDLGFFQLVAREHFTPAPFGSETGNTDGFMINKTYIKFWPAEYHSQSAIDAALQLRAELKNQVELIEKIDIHTFEASYNIIGKYPEAWAPRTRETADHSLPYCTAVALYDGNVTLQSFDEATFTDPARVAFTSKVKVYHDVTLDPGYPHGIPNRITLTLTDGRTLSREVAYPRGHAGNPMTDAEVEAKFRATVEPRYGKARADMILARCWDLESLTSVRDLIALFS
jgi:2-methylcitrate dehydratase